jgi:ribose transport system ATP-binding protein
METVQPLLRVSGLTKSFEGNVVLDHVNFHLNKGEVHILFGENGAGKSTFTKILCGGYVPNEGEIFIEEQRVNILEPANARELGIIAVHQDFSLIPQMSVIDNLYLGREKKRGYFLKKRMMIEEAQRFFKNLNIGIEIDFNKRVDNLSMEKQQVVAIARALLQNIRILILDEPTSNFTERETEILFQQIRRLKANGIGIIYISHIVEELKAIGDRVTILRDGKVVGHIENNNSITKHNLLKGMVEKRAKKENYSISQVSDNTSIELKDISTKSGLKNISLKLNKGEVLGIGGLPGSGKSFIGRAIFGLDKILCGEILLNGKNIS